MPKVFVYGTLRRGFGNHGVMPRDAVFIGNAKTTNRFMLTASGIPYVSEKEAISQITGEVYEVSQEGLEGPLDGLEGHPRWYVRKLTPYELEDGTTDEAWLYFNEQSKGSNLIESGDYSDYARVREY